MLTQSINLTLPPGFAQVVQRLLKNTWPLHHARFDPSDFSQAELPTVYANLIHQLKQNIYLTDPTRWQRLQHIVVEQNHIDDPTLYDIINNSTELSQVLNRIASTTISIIEKINLCYQLYDCHTYLATIEVSTSTSTYYQTQWQTITPATSVLNQHKQPRLLVPLQHARLPYTIIAYSDDNGNCWQSTQTPIMHRWAMQPIFTQFNSQTIYAYLCNTGELLNMNCALYSVSTDFAEQWSPAMPMTTMANVGSPMTAQLLTQGDLQDHWMILYSPDQTNSLLMAAISNDGKRWQQKTLARFNDGSLDLRKMTVKQLQNGSIHIMLANQDELVAAIT